MNKLYSFRAQGKDWQVPTKKIPCRYQDELIDGVWCFYCNNTGKQIIVDENKLTKEEKEAYNDYKFTLQMTSFW